MCKFLVQVTSESYYYMNFCFVPIHNDIKLYKPLMKCVSNFNFTSSQVNMCEKNIERNIFLNLGFKPLLFGFLLKSQGATSNPGKRTARRAGAVFGGKSEQKRSKKKKGCLVDTAWQV